MQDVCDVSILPNSHRKESSHLLLLDDVGLLLVVPPAGLVLALHLGLLLVLLHLDQQGLGFGD